MHDKRIIVFVSLALLVASALADMTPREKWVRWGIDECNGDPNCWTELVSYGGEEMRRRFSENDDRPEIIFFRPILEDDFCEDIPDIPPDAELICGYT
jgi:hypothetical protein